MSSFFFQKRRKSLAKFIQKAELGLDLSSHFANSNTDGCTSLSFLPKQERKKVFVFRFPRKPGLSRESRDLKIHFVTFDSIQHGEGQVERAAAALQEQGQRYRGETVTDNGILVKISILIDFSSRRFAEEGMKSQSSSGSISATTLLPRSARSTA